MVVCTNTTEVSMAIRRINLFAGPGAGKSVTAAGLYYFLGKTGLDVELVREFIKEEMVYNDRFPEGFDQQWIFGSQMHREEKALRNNDLIVTDCPLLLSVVYTEKYEAPGADAMTSQAIRFERDYPSLNIFLDREGIEYKDAGRYQDLEGALEIDDWIKSILSETNTPYVTFRTIDMEKIISYVETSIGEPANVEAA
jgi:nicotinamide riboside kinase